MGSGFALDGFKRLQYTLSLKMIYRSRYREMKEAVSKIKSNYHTFHDRNSLSEKELQQYKKKIKTRIARNRIRGFIFSFLITIILTVTIGIISVFLYNYFLSSF